MRREPPSRQPKLTPEVFELRKEGMTLQAIADKFGVTKVAVHNYLKRPRTRFNLPSVERPCSYCGTPGWYSQEQDPKNAYCSTECYTLLLNEGAYKENRHGQRLGREVVENRYGPLPKGSVVHHVDGNDLNNAPENLVLFASQADHLKHHRNCSHDSPLWSGVPLLCKHD